MNWQAMQPLAAWVFRIVINAVGVFLMTHGANKYGFGMETFLGMATSAGATFWSWWVTTGHLQAAKFLQNVTQTATAAAAVEVAKHMQYTPAVASAASNAKAAVTASDPTLMAKDATKAAAVLLAVLVLGALAFPGDAQAQVKLVKPTGNIVNDIQAATGNAPTPPSATAPAKGTKLGESGCSATGDPIADLHCVIKAGGAKLILHLKQSYALASAPGSITGATTADNTSAMCTKALVPIVDLVVNGPKAGTIAAPDPMALTTDEAAAAADPAAIDGPIVVIEKIRILRLAIQSPALNDACGALVQDEVRNAQSLVGKVTSLITGAGILAPLGL